MTELTTVAANGIRIHVATAGQGPVVLLLHGWPFTWFLWRNVMSGLVAAGYRVVVPDLRGIGHSERPERGYDLVTLARDAEALLDALGAPDADVIGFDLGAPIAWMLAMQRPERVRKLVVMEALLGDLPGAEDFLAHGPPWWFGFHGTADLAEVVLEGHEAEYLDYFFTHHTYAGGIAKEARDTFVAAYTGREALRGGFAHYRAFTENVAHIRNVAATRRLRMPVLAIAGGVVGDALARQLAPLADDLQRAAIPDCGHAVPEEKPDALLAALLPFLASP